MGVAADLDLIAMRGARYGFPGWVTVEETKRGTKRHYMEQRSDAEAKAIGYLTGAKTTSELTGRTPALLLMGRRHRRPVMWLQQSTRCRRHRLAQPSVERQGPGRRNLDSRAERCWVDHTRDSPTGLEASPVFALGANSDGN